MSQLKVLQYRKSREHGAVKLLTVSFYAGQPKSASPTASSKLDLGRTRSGSTKSTSESSMKSGCPDTSIEPDLYAVLEERTCFSRPELVCFLFSILHPMYSVAIEQRDHLLREEQSGGSGSYVTSIPPAQDEESNLYRLQEICLSAAASADEGQLNTVLSTNSWLNTLHAAVYNCHICLCICAVNSARNFPPVLVNMAAQKRIAASGSLKSPRGVAPDFFQLWGIDPCPALYEDVYDSLATAKPLRFVSHKSAHKCKDVLDVTHIFDEQGTHRYVLGVLMDVPEEGNSVKHLQYLVDSALLISHIVKTTAITPTTEHTPAIN